jgi:hypothetical protein
LIFELQFHICGFIAFVKKDGSFSNYKRLG